MAKILHVMMKVSHNFSFAHRAARRRRRRHYLRF